MTVYYWRNLIELLLMGCEFDELFSLTDLLILSLTLCTRRRKRKEEINYVFAIKVPENFNGDLATNKRFISMSSPLLRHDCYS